MADRHLHLTGTMRRRPASGAVNGQVVRVCGQSPLGA
jgi:hypothetical protein